MSEHDDSRTTSPEAYDMVGADLLPGDLSLRQVRHDMRTPLNQIIGYTELLIDEVQDLGELSLVPDLNRIRNAGNTLLALVNEYFGTPARTDPPTQLTDFTHAIVASEERSSSARPGQHRLLVVDDQASNLEVLSRRLVRQDFFVRVASNGQEALDILRSETFDLVLLDVIMPEMDGYAALHAIKQDPSIRHIPVIMISALGELDSVVRCIELGAEDYLTKPFNPILLRARIAACLEKKRLRDQEHAYLAQIAMEQGRSDRLLRNILPDAIAQRLKNGEKLIADRFENTTIVFADLVGFTKLAASLEPEILLGHLNAIFSAFDELVDRMGLEKIKTIGDAYMAASGLPTHREDHAVAAAELAIAMQNEMVRLRMERGLDIQLRIGIHSGPVLAGVIGHMKFAYDLWGDTVNLAHRMEVHGEPGKIHVSAEVQALLGDRFEFEGAGDREIKGKGAIRTSFLVGR